MGVHVNSCKSLYVYLTEKVRLTNHIGQALKYIWPWTFKPISYKPVHEISNNVVCATSKGSDQPAHMRSLIRAFASRLKKLLTEHHLEFPAKLKRRLHRLVWVYTCQNATLLEIICYGSFVIWNPHCYLHTIVNHCAKCDYPPSNIVRGICVINGIISTRHIHSTAGTQRRSNRGT